VVAAGRLIESVPYSLTHVANKTMDNNDISMATPTSTTIPTHTVGARRTNVKHSRRISTRATGTEEADDEDDDEWHGVVSKNEGDADTIVVMAHIHDKIIPVHCGFGTQQVMWLGHVAIARYDEENNQGWRELGVPTKIVTETKDELPLSAIIYDVLRTHSHVYITTSL
jgi:hypothetical protein